MDSHRSARDTAVAKEQPIAQEDGLSMCNFGADKAGRDGMEWHKVQQIYKRIPISLLCMCACILFLWAKECNDDPPEASTSLEWSWPQKVALTVCDSTKASKRPWADHWVYYVNYVHWFSSQITSLFGGNRGNRGNPWFLIQALSIQAWHRKTPLEGDCMAPTENLKPRGSRDVWMSKGGMGQ